MFNQPGSDFVVYLSGCTANCARRYDAGEVPHVVVAAETVDAEPVDEAAIAREVAGRALGHLLGRRPSGPV